MAASTKPVLVAELPKTAIAEKQFLLSQFRFKLGPADGVMGAKTVNAVRRHRLFAGLRANGRSSPAPLRELRVITSAVTGQR